MDDDGDREAVERKEGTYLLLFFFPIFWILNFPFSFFPFPVTSFIDTTHSQFTFFSCENDTCSRLLLQTLLNFEPFPCDQCTELPDNDFCSYFTPTCVFFLSVDNFACFAFVLNSSLSLPSLFLSFSQSLLYLPLPYSLDPQFIVFAV